jgi:Spy/CpxP family protein refolding chaperone
VRAILQRAREARVRLYQAELALRRAVLAVLTPAQRAWLAANGSAQPGPCVLTDAQRTEISALRAAFEEANAADLALVRATYERARAARAAGASRDQIAAILAEAKPALERLRAARRELREKILAVLTPEQRAAGCGR